MSLLKFGCHKLRQFWPFFLHNMSSFDMKMLNSNTFPPLIYSKTFKSIPLHLNISPFTCSVSTSCTSCFRAALSTDAPELCAPLHPAPLSLPPGPFIPDRGRAPELQRLAPLSPLSPQRGLSSNEIFSKWPGRAPLLPITHGGGTDLMTALLLLLLLLGLAADGF